MEAGKELDVLVAEKVMALHVRRDYGLQGNHVLTNADDLIIGEVAHYSTSIAAAWVVVGKLADMGHVVIVKADGLRDGTYNPRYTVLCGNQPRSDAPTAPHAICLAALKAVGGS